MTHLQVSPLAWGLTIGLIVVAGPSYSAQYFAGYLVEKSLSVDNLFVFLIIMTTFKVPAQHQQKALSLGIVLALAMRVRRRRTRSASQLRLVPIPGSGGRPAARVFRTLAEWPRRTNRILRGGTA